MSKTPSCPCKKSKKVKKEEEVPTASTSSISPAFRSRCRIMMQRMKPAPDITMFDNDTFGDHPLMRFRLNDGRTRVVQDRLQLVAERQKRLVAAKKLRVLPSDIPLPEPADAPHRALRSLAESVRPPPMQKRWERDIANRVPRKLRLKYAPLLASLIADAKEEFERGLHEHGLRRTLVAGPDDHWPDLTPPGFKFDGRTERYPLYVRRRKRMERLLFIQRRFMRGILAKAETMFPKQIIDYGIYRNQGMQEFSRLKLVMPFDLRKGEMVITNVWFPKIMAGLKAEWTGRNRVEERLWPRYMKCIQKYVCLQITEFMRRTIDHAIEVFGDPLRTPYLKVDLFFESETETFPSLIDIFGLYHSVLYDITKVAQHLQPLELALGRSSNITFIPIVFPEWYLLEAHCRLQNALDRIFRPVVRYIDDITDKHSILFSKEALNKVSAFISEQHAFEEGRLEIEKYNNIISELHGTVRNVYFDMLKLCQQDFLNAMMTCADNIRNDILAGMLEAHRQANLTICHEFEEIAENAMKVPKNTEELMESGVYMLWATTTFMEKIKERITESLALMAQFMELTTLTKEHVALNTATINWVNDIKPIFEVNSSNYEAYKFEFEEKLLKAQEKLNKDMNDLVPLLSYFDSMDDLNNIKMYIEYVRKFVKKIFIFESDKEWINKEEGLFKFQKSEFKLLDEMKTFVMPFYSLIYMCFKWQRYYYTWMDGPFEYLEGPFVEETTDEYNKDIMRITKTYKNKIRQDILDEVPLRFKGIVDDPRPSNLPAPLKLCASLSKHVKGFREYVPIVTALCNPALKQRHWDEMSNIVGYDLTPDAGTSLRKLIKLDFGPALEQFEIISVGANKEQQLHVNLLSMMSEWKGVNFTTSVYKDTGITILSSLDDVQAVLEDHIVKTLAMRGSAFVKPFEPAVRGWYDKLIRVNATIEEWGKVQSQWLYLLPIFSSKDIVAQMPEEGILFLDVDGTYQRYMQVVSRDPRVLETASLPGLLEALQSCSEMLETINNGVNAYLEKKRLFFARFFFLSNDEMLEILSETKDPLRVQPHLKKCFEGINRLQFDEKLNIKAMISAETEEIELVDEISTEEARGSVEKWLLQVEEQMVKSVRQEMENSYFDYTETRREVWVTIWPGQIVLCISQIFWAMDVHRSMEVHRVSELEHFHQTLVKQLNDVVGLIRSPLLSNLARISIKSLIVIDVHAKDVVQELIDKRITYDTDFQWLAQLRYYYETVVLVKITNATVKYAYEYLGNTDRLVITPLTDRCYRTLIGAYHLHLNGAPEGPAGTGKTETTKDLAKALAVQCVVFNCSDGLDYKAMGKFFKGLASCGAWACFDEFNRIELEVLSVIAQQILCIIQAVRSHVETFIFEGTEIRLNPAVYVCITMNPGYAGRSELPDNLKVLFRTVAMMVPDYAMIGEISLYSFGFVTARVLSVKIVTVYRLCSEQLSSQNHYDYGMRAVKTVLSAAGNNKRKYPDENEDILLLRSITDVNLPKFLSHDVPLFQGIILDLFPGITLPEPDYDIFLAAMRAVCSEMKLQSKDSVILKVIQTYEMMIVRHGFMLVGEPFSGKTSTLKVLAATMTRLFKQGDGYAITKYEFVNPKAITMGQLYGMFDPVSYEWTDGVAATIFRNFANDPSPDRKFLIFDGPVDAVWIENMNTVLDDNKKLCLTSGEVITMTNVMSMIFEVMDLTQASPATVSRCGMIYMEPQNLGWHAVLKSWLLVANPVWVKENVALLETMFIWAVTPSLEYVRKYCHNLVFAGEMNLVTSTMRIFEMSMNEACSENDPEEAAKYMTSWFQGALMNAVVWGVAGILDFNSRQKFDIFYRAIWKEEDPANPVPPIMEAIEIAIPGEGLLFDYMFVYKMKGVWKYWPDIIKSTRSEEASTVTAQVIPTIDTARYSYQLDFHVRHNIPMLLVGPTGTGKSFYIQSFLMNKLSEEKYEPAFITFTTQTSAFQTQDLVISKLQKKKRGIYGPTKGKICVIFIDDLNMPAKEIYGAQPPIELIRQYFDHKHWYDLKTASKLYVRDILFISAMGLPGGSRQVIYNRFLRHFCIYSINEFSDESMHKIFSLVLLNGFKKNGFATDVMFHVNQIVAATLDIYKVAIADLRPTPLKSHYVFNLRDIARVIQGCGLLRKESADDRTVFAKLWVHEILRVFGDRLIDDGDRNWLLSKIQYSVAEFLRERLTIVLDNYTNADGEITLESLRNLMFGTFMDVESLEEERKYEEIPGIDQFTNIGEAGINEYNATHKTKLTIVLFTYALEHLSKICRILAMPNGNGLLVGIGGSGRQSLVRLATTLMGYGIFQPEITKNYNLTFWRDDIKKVMKDSGGTGKDLVFLFTEMQIKEEAFLQDIDSLLNSGEVPNIYAIDEKQEILEMTRLAAQGGNRNLDVSPLQVFAFFINRVKIKLHIILSFSPIGSAFRSRLRLYPSLVNCCTIDWMEGWPEDSLEMVAKRYMTDINIPEEDKAKSTICCKYFHVCAVELSDKFFAETSRKTYITSASYLDLIKAFCAHTNSKQQEIMTAKMRYVVGLEKLLAAANAVSEMQAELEMYKPELVLMAAKSKKMMEEIEVETRAAEKTSDLVKKDEKVAKVQAAQSQALKKECEADLAQALPILNEALAALNTLKPADITLVKSMKNPPAAVKLVMAAVCVIKNIAPDRIPDPNNPGRKIMDYWGPSKKLLGDMKFLENLKDFDKDNIPPAIMDRIRKEFIPNKIFKPNIVAKASSAAEGLCKWIIAMDLYDVVAKVVGPKKAKLAAAEKEFAETMAVLNEKRDLAKRLEERVKNLNSSLDEANEKKQKMEDAVNLCISKLYRAEKLIGGLGGEKTRWSQAAENLQMLYDCLAGDILVSCGVIAYLAPFTTSYRAHCIEDWRAKCIGLKIPSSKTYTFAKVLGSDIKIENWYIDGLPRDSFSTDNAIIQDSSYRWSLLVDPQGQANKWIKTMEKLNDLAILKFTDATYMKTLEKCIETGRPALIENINEELEAPLDPLLARQTFKQGGIEFMSIGDSVVEYNKNFKLYLTSKLRNPHYLPEVFNRVTIINFALTVTGLEDQLLGIVVAKERPDLQEKRQMLIIQSAENKTALKRVEDDILRTLSESKGDILEDESAIEVLDSSKILSDDIMKKQEITKETEIKIDGFRMSYRPIATHSSNLYYCVTDLPNVDPMYQYSLGWFINLYILSIETSNKSKELERRLRFLRETFTYNLYSNVCRSLFEKDKLMFSFILCTKIMLASGDLDQREFMFFLTGGVHTENPVPNPASDWLSDKYWDEICRVDDLPSFKGFSKSFVESVSEWKKVYDMISPQEAIFPKPWSDNLTPFQRLIVIRLIRADKITATITIFVEKEMGTKFIMPPGFDISKSYDESNCLAPLIFILSPGADPMDALIKFAEQTNMTEKFSYISLGQGQGPIAQALIEKAQGIGGWVCLQNCHLAASWMPNLEKIWESFDTENTSIYFRLWLTSYPSAKFPTSILQFGVKMTNEPPTGLQANLMRSYTSEPVKDPVFFDGCPGKEKIFTKLLYGMCFFHAVVQERRKFGPLGWNIPYGFNESDFQISVRQLQMFINEFDEVPFVAICYLTGECNYGGRVTDNWDRRCIVTILEDFINPRVIKDPGYMFADIGPEYGLPKKCEYKDFIRNIEAIPIMPPPDVFGLHMNAGITQDMQVSMLLIDSMLLVQGQVGTSSGAGDLEKALLATINEIIAKTPRPFDIEESKMKFPVLYSESMNTVICQEMERFNKLVVEIVTSLDTLRKAIEGLVVMTPALEVLSNSIVLGRIPPSWDKVSYPSLKSLAAYFADFLERLQFLQAWHDSGKPDNFWLSGFFFTQAFLTGAMQNFARKYVIPIDTLTFDFEVLRVLRKDSAPDDGVYVYGLFVVGAKWNWNKTQLEEQLPKVLSDVMPLIWLKPVLMSKFEEKDRYKCPLYKTSERRGILSTTGHSTNYVLPFYLNSDVPVRHWIKRSVALLCQLD